ncbi:hypothetical protein [Candidatus Regiella insecticola]|uniref:hypothetical protein n=1 Tax=Candidatus Regiella insecticola TaxID=138073 RepID=UPI000309D12F|nr:hypothetical protein [Candidatus Regiella insecticola]
MRIASTAQRPNSHHAVWPNQFNLIQGEGVQTVQIARQAMTTQNQIKMIWL